MIAVLSNSQKNAKEYVKKHIPKPFSKNVLMVSKEYHPVGMFISEVHITQEFRNLLPPDEKEEILRYLLPSLM